MRIPDLVISGLLILSPAINPVYSQANERILPDTSNTGYRKITRYLTLSGNFITKDKDSSLHYLQLCADLCAHSELASAPAIFFEIARQYHSNNEYARALEFFNLAAMRAEEMDDRMMLVHSRSWAGYIHSQLGESENAIEMLLANLDYAIDNEIDDYIPEANMMLGFAYRDCSDNYSAMKYFNAARESAESSGIKNDLSTILNETGNLHVMEGNIDLGLDYQFKALEMRLQEKNTALIGYSYNDIANSYYLRKDFNRAIQYFEKSLAIQKELKNDWAVFYCQINLATIFNDIKQYSLQKACLDSAKTIADDLRMKPVYESYYETSLHYYENINDYREVYNQYRLLNAYRDSMKTEGLSREIARITARYDAEKKDREIERQKARNQKLKLITGLLVTGIAFLIITSVLLIRSYAVKKKINRLLEQKNREILEKNEMLEKNASEILRQRDEYQKLNATKDKFFSIIAHDLKNPFSGIIGLTDILISDNKLLSEKELSEVYADLNQASKVTYSLLENLLLWARSQTKSLQVSPEIIDADRLNNEIISLYEKQVKTRNIELTGRTEPGLQYLADPNMIRTVMRNLVSNAVKFTGDNGRITITAVKKGNHAEITVEDTGKGMDKESIGKLFRIDINTLSIGDHRDKGSGLGLILCREFVEMNGGEIGVESTPGKGSIFRFTVPLPEHGFKS